MVKYRRAQESAGKRRALKTELDELLENEASSEEIIDRCQHHMETAQLSDVDTTVMVSCLGRGHSSSNHDIMQLWRCIMASVEWNKKEELVAEQALKHLKVIHEFLCSLLHVYTNISAGLHTSFLAILPERDSTVDTTDQNAGVLL